MTTLSEQLNETRTRSRAKAIRPSDLLKPKTEQATRPGQAIPAKPSWRPGGTMKPSDLLKASENEKPSNKPGWQPSKVIGEADPCPCCCSRWVVEVYGVAGFTKCYHCDTERPHNARDLRSRILSPKREPKPTIDTEREIDEAGAIECEVSN